MSGTTVLTTLGRDAVANALLQRISYFKLGEGGFILSQEVSEVVETAATGLKRDYTHTITGGDFDIIGVDTGTQTFEIAGENAEFFPDGVLVAVEDSTGNDGLYTVAAGGASEAGGNTFITMVEAVPSATADGLLYVSRLPIAIGPTDDATHYPLVVEELTPGLVVVQTMTDTTGTGDLTGDGTGTVNYKTGALDVSFTNLVGAGNSIKVRFKYHDRRKDASVGNSYTDIEAEQSAVAPDGGKELFTYTKAFGADVDTEVILRGTGYATVRCKMKLQAVEGIDDGRGTTYGGIPYYFEGGVFDEDDVLLAYFTFDKQRKVAPLEIFHTLDFIF